MDEEKINVVTMWKKDKNRYVSFEIIGVWHVCAEEVDSDASIGYDGERWFIQVEDRGDKVSIKYCPFCGIDLIA